MKKNIFVEEFARRGRNDDNAYSMLGTELKRVRTSQSQTLSSVAGDLCSVSYLCKIEKAQLKPNRYMLNEICKKLNLSEPQVQLLFELHGLLLKMVEYYYLDDLRGLEEVYKQCNVFDNYRTKLISLIYCISVYKLEEATGISKELFKITNVMRNDELSIFMVFYSILKYYEEEYQETLDNLRSIQSLGENDNALFKIAKLCSLECYIKLNSPMALLSCQELIDTFLKASEFEKADYVRYLQGLYLIKNSMLDVACKEISYIRNHQLKNSLELFLDVVKHQLKESEYYSDLRPYFQLLSIYIFDRKNYLAAFIAMDKSDYYDCDFNYNIINYLTLSEDEERLTELTRIIIPNVAQTKNTYEKNFFLNELCRISSKFGRYKGFCKAYASLLPGGFWD